MRGTRVAGRPEPQASLDWTLSLHRADGQFQARGESDPRHRAQDAVGAGLTANASNWVPEPGRVTLTVGMASWALPMP